MEPIPAGQGLIPTDQNYVKRPRVYGILSENQYVLVTFVNPDANQRPFSARLTMKYNITRTDSTLDRMSKVKVESIDPESYLELNKDQLSYMNGDAWKCDLPDDKLIYNYTYVYII